MKKLRALAFCLLLPACTACGESGDDGGGGGKASGGASSGGSSGAGGGTGGTTAGGGGAGGTSSGGVAGSTGGGVGGGGTSSGGAGGTSSGGAGGTSSGGTAGTGVGPCPTFADGVETGKIAFAGVNEASGIVESRKNTGVFWVNNDSGDGPKLYALTKTGTHLGVFTFAGAQAADWEDIATGPGPTAGEKYLYAGDIGDNAVARANIKIYRVAEPSVSAAGPAQNVTLNGVETFTFTYPDGAHNAETLLVDPKTGDLFIVVKAGTGTSPVFRASAPLASGVLSQVASLTFGVAPLAGGATTTGGDISPSGDAILIRTYGTAFLWRRGAGMSVAKALEGVACPVPHKAEQQGEAIGFAADASGYYTTSEGLNQPLYYFAEK